MFKLHLIPSKRIKEINVICYTVQQRHPLNSPACSAGRECSTAAIAQISKQIVVKTRQQHQLYFFFFFLHTQFLTTIKSICIKGNAAI